MRKARFAPSRQNDNSYSIKNNEVEKIINATKYFSMTLIEETALAANQAVGDLFRKRGLPTIYRVHPPKDPEEIESVVKMLSEHGIRVPNKETLSGRDVGNLIRIVRRRPNADAMIQRIMGLVERAAYAVKDHEDVAKHWGLAREAYLHFTSPIRRYPDLFVHRWLHAIETRGAEAAIELKAADFIADMNDMANHSSLQAGVAEMAEQAIGDLKVCQFMSEHVGERHEAKVMRVSKFGIEVHMAEFNVGGFLPSRSIGENAKVRGATLQLQAGRRQFSFTEGFSITIRIQNVDFIRLQVIPGTSLTPRDNPSLLIPNRMPAPMTIDDRRDFLKLSALGGSALILPAHRPIGNYRANNKLDIGVIGAGGKGHVDTVGVASENIVALCDVDDRRAAATYKKFPNAKRYRDFRVMLEKQKLDAVVISTPDHTHAPAAVMAMNLGKHIYVQKPLTHTVEEARVLTELARKTGVATSMGNQGTGMGGLREAVEVVRAGAIGKVREVHVWTNRPIWPQGMARNKAIEAIPATLRWDLWLGPAPHRPYNGDYAPFKWRGFWDFGTGALGDMACHILNMPYMALGAGRTDNGAGQELQ